MQSLRIRVLQSTFSHSALTQLFLLFSQDRLTVLSPDAQDQRKETFDFSEPYYTADVTVAVADGSDIKSFEDLAGKKVAVKTATNGADFAKSIADQYGFTVVEFKDSPTMYQDVIAGNTAACFEDYPVMAYNIQQGAALVIPDGMLGAGSDYGFGKSSTQVLKTSRLTVSSTKSLTNTQSNPVKILFV